MNEVQKQREEYYLDRFKFTYSDFPAGTIRADEKPDFLVEADHGIGIELTELYRSDSEREFQGKHPRRSENDA